ncbi:MAG: MBL fold metallo-hydrolase [Pedosphaera sp.]|nr:MBL fold metallo-hydrolase [Pedosphaera sp.]
MHPARRIALAALATALASATPAFAGPRDGTLDFYWIDSQGGGSTLIVSPTGESVLIDTGNPGDRDPSRIHLVATTVAGLKQIDHLITTHLHIDHFGGAAELSQKIPIHTVHDNGIPERDPDGGNNAAWPLKIKAYRDMNVAERIVVHPGSGISLKQPFVGPALTLQFVAAKQQFALPRPASGTPARCSDTNPKPTDTSDNANSIVSLLQFGRFRYFNGGDLSWNIEAQLVCPMALIGSVDVYQVNHHGLDVSSNPLLLRALQPNIAVMNNGPSKGCMTEVVQSLRGLPSLQAIYQVHRNLKQPENNAPAEFCANNGETGGAYIKLSVSSDGTSYTVTVPSTGHRQTYATRF